MKKVSLKKCKWCNGSGYDPEHIGYKCWDCKGTGYEEGERAREYELYLMNKKEKELERKGFLF